MQVGLPQNGWTGGQYSVYRVLFGTYLLVHFASLLPYGTEMFSSLGVLPASASPLLHAFPNLFALNDGPGVVTAVLCAAVCCAALLTIGAFDRVAALLLWYFWACLFGRNPLISNPGLPYVGILLLVHAALPPAPYGSWTRRSLGDPGASWRIPPPLFAAVWTVMAVGYSYSGYTKLVSPSWLDGTAVSYVLQSPLARPGALGAALLMLPNGALKLASYAALVLELGFAPFALIRRLRPWLWCAMLGMHLVLILLIDFADLSLGMVMLHLFTFNPAWVGKAVPSVKERLFYDGHCGLCHRFVRLTLSEDRDGALRYAPLQGELFAQLATAEQRAALGDSVVVQTHSGLLLSKSAAVLHVMQQLGGLWRVLAKVGAVVPLVILDRVYDGIAQRRHRIFARPADVCPLVPKELRQRFDA